MTKIKCVVCGSIAVWVYAPNTDNNYYCDNCVPRGCSCNFDENNKNEYKDDQGRSLPCCEYTYDQNGYEIIITEEDHKEALEELKELWIKNDSDEDMYTYDYILYLIKDYENSI